MTKFKTYADQVNAAISSMVQITPHFDDYSDDPESLLAETYISNDAPHKEIDLEIFQVYVVNLKFGVYEDTPVFKELGIVWSDKLEAYLLPVTHFGMPWEGIAAINMKDVVYNAIEED